MQLRRIFAVLSAASLTAVAALAAAPAQAHEHRVGTRSLATVLAADGGGFDRKRGDFDILDNAVRAVLAAKPKSSVGVLTDGSTRLTAFAPTDGAFRRLVKDLTGKRYPRERRVFNELAGMVGIDAVETVLLYHVVPGAVITNRQARKANGAVLQTALDGATLEVRVRPGGRVFLVDADPDDRNARLKPSLRDLNKGNRQIAHGISQVLRPADF